MGRSDRWCDLTGELGGVTSRACCVSGEADTDADADADGATTAGGGRETAGELSRSAAAGARTAGEGSERGESTGGGRFGDGRLCGGGIEVSGEGGGEAATTGDGAGDCCWLSVADAGRSSRRDTAACGGLSGVTSGEAIGGGSVAASASAGGGGAIPNAEDEVDCLLRTLEPVPLRETRGDGAAGAVSKIVSKWKIITVTTA
mmetsp:Transcript_3021/g.9428  ORF Transcript_3021/g.9428 Transcript_3021/m.9428 type:complete len:203 (-) Transcript_3021:2106-2714(-)